MKRAIDETNRRRKLQKKFNKKHGITPETIKKSIQDILGSVYEADHYTVSIMQEAEGEYISINEIPKKVKKLKKEMISAAKELEFERATELRDEIKKLEELELSVRG
jgi:excinuclease ABC subunit B